ncbi:MAG TPA: PAS domain S-box protein [Cyanophyceae cyanobacterium]
MTTPVAQTLTIDKRNVEAEQNPILCDALEKFFTLTLDMFFIAGFDGYFKQLSPMCETILGLTTQELLSQSWLELIHPDDRKATREYLHRLTRGTDKISFESRCRCKDGSYKWLLWNATACHNQQLIYAVARDNTDCKQAEAAYRESEEHFRLLVDGVKDYAIVMLDPQGRIVSWNAGAERIHQYKSSQIIGEHISCFYPREDIELGIPKQGLAIAAQEGHFEEEGWRVRKDGSQFWANVVITALYSDDGTLTGFARVTRDITERKLAQKARQQAYDELERRVEERTTELRQINERLIQEIAEHKRTEVALRQSKTRLKKQAQELEAETQHARTLLQELQRTQAQLIQTEKMSSLGQMVAGIAHEINNPVGFIYCNIDYAICYIKDLMRLVELYVHHYPQPVPQIRTEMDAIDFDFLISDLPKLLSSMKVGANRIRQIVLSLQNFLGAAQTEMMPIDIHEGIDSTLLILQNRLKATPERKEITIRKEYGSLPLVECWAGQLNQVFMNLLTNAIEAFAASSTRLDCPHHITISTGLKDIRKHNGEGFSGEKIPHAVIRIADNGPGITEDVRRRLFDPFFTTKPVGKGTGLGLSIAYQIVVEHHGGQLTCNSEPGKGAEFFVAIPIQHQNSSSEDLSQCA